MLKRNQLRHLAPFTLALLLASTWTYITREMYDYNMGFASFLGLSLFPLISWTVALTIGFAVMQHILHKLGVTRPSLQLVTIVLIYAIAVIIVETLGYYTFGIKNIDTNQFAGLPLCNCLHAPVWMQAGYFIMGPLHWMITRFVAKDYPKQQQNAVHP